jgi:hypothetical protein
VRCAGKLENEIAIKRRSRRLTIKLRTARHLAGNRQVHAFSWAFL